MLAGSYMVVSRKNSEIGVGALLGVVVSQALGYGLVFDINFFFRYLPSFLPTTPITKFHSSNIAFWGVEISVSSVDY
jgi:hypothetical protein